MSKHLVQFEPTGLRVLVDASYTILDAIRELGLHIMADCGGKGTCGKCRITVEPFLKPTQRDIEHIPSSELKQGIRLACAHNVTENMRVLLPQYQPEVKILTESVSRGWLIDDNLVEQYGIAIDLGTTTIVAFLLDLATGTQLAQAASLNPQSVFGEDVMSRITFVMRETTGSKRLQKVIIGEIGRLASKLIHETGIPSTRVTRITVVGNTAMNHLFLGADVKQLGLAPYEPSIHSSTTRLSKHIGLHIGQQSELYTAPNIAGFVGGDTVAFILSQQLHHSSDVVLGIDIGTNGEIVLSNRGDLFCCSAAAGPAFEGATIHHGMRGQLGAIEYVSIPDLNAKPDISVIGNVSPLGLCGSAIVDIVAELKRVDLLDIHGRLQRNSSRVREDDRVGLHYVVCESGEVNNSREILFTQKDVRQVQLAKAAIRTGAQVLLEEISLKISDIDRLLLAGAFGNYIKPSSALAIGLLPSIDMKNVIPVGNAAGDGAKGLLLSNRTRLLADSVAKQIKYIELASHNRFQDIFLESIPFP